MFSWMLRRLLRPFGASGSTPPTAVGAFVCLNSGLRGCGGGTISAIYVGNDSTVFVSGANVNGTYLNAATVQYSLYGEGDAVAAVGPVTMLADGLGTGGYTAELSAAALAAAMTAGELFRNRRYRLHITFVSAPFDAETDVYYPLLYRPGNV